MPEPHGMLVGQDGHVHDPGQRLHPAVRLLLGAEGKDGGAVGRRTGSRGRSGQPAGTEARRDHIGHCATIWPTAARSIFINRCWPCGERTGATVEVLTPDFLGKPGAIERVVAAAPEVFNHNTETVPRLYRQVRGRKSDYRWTLELLRRVKQLDPSIKTKSGLMLGLGETRDELLDTLADLVAAGCDFLTLGQYLQPTPAHLPVDRYVPPEEFDELGRLAGLLGFKQVASGPFVRSSYHARDMAEAL